jgi:hypothetical protein
MTDELLSIDDVLWLGFFPLSIASLWTLMAVGQWWSCRKSSLASQARSVPRLVSRPPIGAGRAGTC